ncbi:MAG: bifunctional 4-hydroxy-2-oxoglutarate aldolase/2-dehydro-3-deoxy-phosphogluconate aldolase [Armatimonadota bacterium]|nr:bifunctional 4-hydroxy-2-oxoglutarate aldolase/2-dehydro-3-deoxy-phosphogluconate aldolase [Armatimonadota bacterium]MDR7426367.1 bifunctional 4-hydroxy-2-oxoglutarate aldolase/2-dehydro-3-deoxy-phosphogluconate aldolase [Armatimonadota bacterium]MDR7463335.1 bifunctional 4-hydroxy-2-oxoglutarate aldolase/2-dehydro-3-deoxy-phosphogluconate aldolase [Armatimonadota bacterium]MDR7469149.1 bifunctional 4-hydroxy-2-oxoglutarate aldolase/2-dehydro-3-deoxy-phosphogluconate aldolase [Armatimonadota 
MRDTGVGTAQSVRAELLTDGLLAILRGFPRNALGRLVEVLLSAGVRFVEITVEGGAFDQIQWIGERYAPQVRLGAGTVITAEDARRALDAGAAYLVSPGLFPDVASVAREAKAFYLPGVTTATEVGLALRAGLDVQKLFPAGLLGPEYLRALRGPYPGLRAFAIGNMSLDRIEPMLRAGAAGVALGGAIFGRGGDLPPPQRVAATVRRVREMLRTARG